MVKPCNGNCRAGKGVPDDYRRGSDLFKYARMGPHCPSSPHPPKVVASDSDGKTSRRGGKRDVRAHAGTRQVPVET